MVCEYACKFVFEGIVSQTDGLMKQVEVYRNMRTINIRPFHASISVNGAEIIYFIIGC